MTKKESHPFITAYGLVTFFIGVICIVSVDSIDDGYFTMGGIFCSIFITSAYITRFWTEFDSLGPVKKFIGWLAPFIGITFACLLVIALFTMRLNTEKR